MQKITVTLFAVGVELVAIVAPALHRAVIGIHAQVLAAAIVMLAPDVTCRCVKAVNERIARTYTMSMLKVRAH